MSTKTCPKCQNTHNLNGKFCSKSCANSRGPRTEEFKTKVRNKLSGRTNKMKGVLLKERFQKFCFICNKELWVTDIDLNKNITCKSKYCKSESCRLAGINSARSRKNRSKDEIKLFELCESYFKNVSHNEPVIEGYGWDADIILRDHKIAILWNGPWHYKDMGLSNHSLNQVKNRDKIKIQLFEKHGWKVLIFEDRTFTPEQAFVVVRDGTAPPSARYERVASL
jgi:hypothetical protein